ncbi:hypothetical protein BAE44_0018506 [Dichanthelium oligosanthes]|uniref:C2H2-type domain-containing protein n=1 Tax=Dichanthelium oligosanthes TaxID=888268 RepID=A0A1E5V5X6_9POAL|nr:hypothetical protein BAE44_0018506 [Dichanthelium oligosanthes]
MTSNKPPPPPPSPPPPPLLPSPPPRRSREAYGLLRDAAQSGLGFVAAEPYMCTICSRSFGREKKLQAHMRLAHRDGSTSPPSFEEAFTPPKRASKKLKPKSATVKMEPRDDEPPLPLSMIWGATSLRGQSPIHAAGEELAGPDRSLVANALHNVTGTTQVGVNGVNQPGVAEISRGEEDLVSFSTHQLGHVLGLHIDGGHVDQAVAPPAENPEVTVSGLIVIEDDSSDDDNANPTIAVTGFGVVASSAPDAAAFLPMARAPAAATTVIDIPDDSSDDDNAIPINAVTGIGAVANSGPDAAAVLPMPRAPAAAAAAAVAPAPGPHVTASLTFALPAPAAAATAAVTIPWAPAPAAAVTIATAPPAATMGVATPMAPDTVRGNGFHEAGARYSNGGYGKAGAGYRNVGYGKAADGYSSGGYGYGRTIAVGGQRKRGLGYPYKCTDCDETFYSPQALGGHAAGHRHKEKSKAMLDLQIASVPRSGRHVCTLCDMVFPKGQAVGWHNRKVHCASLISAASGASSSSAPHPAAAVQPSEAIAMNHNAAPIHGPANATRHGSFPASARSTILALPALGPLHKPPRATGMAGNPVAGLVAGAHVATGSSSLPATTSVLPAIPLQNQEDNPPAVVPGNHGGRTIRIGFVTFPAFPSQNQENPPEEVAVAPGNGEHRSIRLSGFNTSPPFPWQSQEENPPEIVPGNRRPEEVAVVPGSGEPGSIRLFGVDISPPFALQSQEENPPEELVPGNHGPPTVHLFGANTVEGPEEPKK